MKTNPRCDHEEGNRRCLDSAGYRIRQLTFVRYARYELLPGRFCLQHAHPAANRISLNQLPPEDR